MRVTRIIGIALILAACSRRDAGTGDTGIAMNDTGMAAGDTVAAIPPAPLSDANIVFILDHANMLDSAAGAVAAEKGTASDVREYARMMMRDHHTLRQQGQALATKLGVTPAAPANDASASQTTRTMALLNGATKGRDFDKAYIDNEVTYHLAVLETATAAMSAAQNAELKNLIQKAAPLIQAHLDRAKAIQSGLQ
jgi:putative membrane protein